MKTSLICTRKSRKLSARRPRRWFNWTTRRKRQRGVSLVEVGVSMTVFLAGALGTLGYFSYSQMSLNLEGCRRCAAQLTHTRVEELRTVSFDLLPTCGEENTEVHAGSFTGSRRTTIEDVDEDTDGSVDYRKATVQVSWAENGADQAVELVTFLSEYR